MNREKDLQELVKRLKEAAGDNLQAVVLYGSAADNEFHEEHSDLNVLCLLQRSSGAELARLQPVGLWWSSKGHPAPLLFTLQELQHSADVFAIELLDMKQRHRMLWGEEIFSVLWKCPCPCTVCNRARAAHQRHPPQWQAALRSRQRRAELTELMIGSRPPLSLRCSGTR